MAIPKWDTGMVEVAEGAYAYLQYNGGWCLSNAGLLVGPESAIVVDALMTRDMTRSFLGAIDQVTDKPLSTVVNTHHHIDHSLGNGAFRERGATIVSQRLAREEIVNGPSPALAAQIFKQFDFSGAEVSPPTMTFDDGLTLYLGERPVEVIYVGHAHTRGDTIVYLPDAKLVYAGDVAFFFSTPLALEGHISHWIDVVDRIAGMAVERIVPGHGPVAGKQELLDMRGYLVHIREQARSRFEAGMAPLTAARDIDLGPYKEWVDSARIAANVMRLYAEFRGEPIAPLDRTEAFAAMDALDPGGMSRAYC